jgi:phenylalanyl-tRNA synthetase alpha chain
VAIDDKVSKTLAELGVADAAGVQSLFAEVRAAMQAESRDRERWRNQPPNSLRNRWLARHNSLLAQIDERWRKAAPKELVPIVGREFNTLKKEANEALDVAVARIEKGESPWTKSRTKADRAEAPDLTLPGTRRPHGSIHPITRVQREIEDIFLGLGFAIETGPEVETVYYNFDALNIPESHPARDDWDTLYIDSQTVLRTHTSPVQIRAMEKYGAPLYIVIPGKCYRNDKPDASHSPMFHQMEGLAVDVDITFADLKGTLDFFAKKFFGERVRTSFRPSFFPFTEPSGEVHVSCAICDGQGCSVCKQSGWIEVMGCGMVHPQVLQNGGIDPDRYSGWAFGLGIDRFAMMKYGIDDIQLFFHSDLRFLKQF